jgi:hypothetical protein
MNEGRAVVAAIGRKGERGGKRKKEKLDRKLW